MGRYTFQNFTNLAIVDEERTVQQCIPVYQEDERDELSLAKTLD